MERSRSISISPPCQLGKKDDSARGQVCVCVSALKLCIVVVVILKMIKTNANTHPILIKQRILSNCLIALMVYFTPSFYDSFPVIFFMVAFVLAASVNLMDSSMFISQNAFIASISDEGIGGTYVLYFNYFL